MKWNSPCALFQDSSQIGLLKELLDLQKDMVVMLLSLLEGSYKHVEMTTDLGFSFTCALKDCQEPTEVCRTFLSA